MCGDLAAYVAHSSRKSIMMDDVELLLKRQRMINEQFSLSGLMRKLLPAEYVEQVIPVARSRNVLCVGAKTFGGNSLPAKTHTSEYEEEHDHDSENHLSEAGEENEEVESSSGGKQERTSSKTRGRAKVSVASLCCKQYQDLFVTLHLPIR